MGISFRDACSIDMRHLKAFSEARWRSCRNIIRNSAFELAVTSI